MYPWTSGRKLLQPASRIRISLTIRMLGAMELESPGEITKILSAATGGDRSAVDQLYVILYPELRALAHRQVRRVDGSDIVDTTSLVNESYLRFVNAGRLSVSDRRQFLAYAAHVMRSVVVDFVRRARAQRRGGRNVHVSLDTNLLGSLESPADEIIRINELLDELATVDARLVSVVEMRYFAGLENDEIAESLGVNARTVRRDLQKVRLMLLETP